MISGAPAIVGIRPRSRYGAHEDARHVRDAAYAWRYCVQPIAVIVGGKHLGWVRGTPHGRETHWFHPLIATTNWPTQNTLINTITNSGKSRVFAWAKMSASAVVDSWHDLWGCVGTPTRGDWSGTAKTARQFSDSTTGSVWHGGNVSSSEKVLTRQSIFVNGAVVPRSFILYDRVLSYDACTMTASNQSMTNTLAAQRYIGSGEPGLQMMMCADTVHNATAANLTVCQYTDDDGNTLQSMPTTPTVRKVPSAAAPTSNLPARVIAPTSPGSTARTDRPFLPLIGGDSGVRLVDNYTWSAAPTGTFSLALVFPLAYIPGIGVNGTPVDYDYTAGLDAMNIVIKDGACLSFLQLSRVAAASNNFGWLEFAWT